MSKRKRASTKSQLAASEENKPSLDGDQKKIAESETKNGVEQQSRGLNSHTKGPSTRERLWRFLGENEKQLQILIPSVFSVLVLAVIVVQAIITKWQWDAMENQGQTMQASNEETRRNRELEYRAYVVVKTVRFIPRKDLPVLGDIIVTEFNSGRTPGIGKIQATMGLLKESPSEDAPIPAPEFQSTIVFAPLVDVNTTVAAFPVEQDAFVKKNNASSSKPTPENAAEEGSTNFLKDRKIYIYGRIDYVDIFRKSRWTKFCFVNIPGTDAWSFCSTFNSTDQQDQIENEK